MYTPPHFLLKSHNIMKCVGKRGLVSINWVYMVIGILCGKRFVHVCASALDISFFTAFLLSLCVCVCVCVVQMMAHKLRNCRWKIPRLLRKLPLLSSSRSMCSCMYVRIMGVYATYGREPLYMTLCISSLLTVRVGAQLGLPQMMTVEIKIPNRMVGLGKYECTVCSVSPKKAP